MMTIDETQRALESIAASLPEAIFDQLNGGILLKEERRYHPADRGNDLMILGEYRSDPVLGRFIVIYYGSLAHAFSGASDARFREELERVVKHELTHHLEHRAGSHDLEKQDEIELLHYLAYHAESGERA